MDIVENIFVHYKRSGKKLEWDSNCRSLLDFTEENDIDIDSGCRFGDCGTCLSALLDGEVKYLHPTLVQAGKNECLPCSCVPVTDIVLDI